MKTTLHTPSPSRPHYRVTVDPSENHAPLRTLDICSYGRHAEKQGITPLFTHAPDTLRATLAARRHVADVYAPEYAALLASAPAMLEALKDCEQSLSRLPDVDGAYRVTVLQMARKAIRQAEGTA